MACMLIHLCGTVLLELLCAVTCEEARAKVALSLRWCALLDEKRLSRYSGC